MNSISANLNVMIKASEKASKILIRDFGEIENLQVSKKGPADFDFYSHFSKITFINNLRDFHGRYGNIFI